MLRWNDLSRLRVNRLSPDLQDRVIAAATFAFGGVLYLVGLYPLFTDHSSGAPLWTRFFVLAVLCMVQLWRRRAPGVALGVGTAVLAVDMALNFSAPALIVYSDLVYAATLYGRARLSRAMIPLAAVGAIAATVTALLTFPDWRVAVVAACACLPFLIIPVWWATNIRQQRDIADSERAAAAALGRLAELDRKAAVAAERARMARDLHDAIAGHLSAIAIQSSAALSMNSTPGERQVSVRTVLSSVRENSVRALEEMRAMIGLLSDPASVSAETNAPTRLAQLSTLVESARASGLPLRLRSDLGEPEALPTAVDLAAYRIIQEALTNVLKHAPGRATVVRLQRGEGVLTVEVRNELAAARRARDDENDGQGRGLANMRERASAVAGSLTAAPSGDEWVVRAVLPVPGSSTDAEPVTAPVEPGVSR